MIELDISLAGETQMSRALLVSSAALADFHAPLAEAATELQKSFQMNFDARGQLFGGWAPRKKDQPWPLLEKTGNLRKSFFTRFEGPNTAVLGNKAKNKNGVEYAPFHQFGTSKMPARLLMKVNEAQKVIVQKIFQAHIIKSTKGLR